MFEVECGDMRVVLATLPENSIDAIVCDPPYELGFMGKAWDSTGVAFDVETWRAAYRVLKPGGHMVAFGGTRTFHRIACAIEDAGFQIRDSLAWLYGQGFPKSMNLGKAIDKLEGAEREVVGSRVLTGSAAMSTEEKGGTYASNTDSRGRTKEVAITASATELAKKWEGWGTALKPCFEPIILARKPPIGTIVENLKAYGVGGLNIDGCRTPVEAGGRPHIVSKNENSVGVFGDGLNGSRADGVTIEGRWPPNVICDEDVAADLDETNGVRTSQPYPDAEKQKRGQVLDLARIAPGGYSDTGGVSRYFYCPKAGSKERDAGLDHWPVLTPAELTGRSDSDAPGTTNPRSGASASKSGGRRNPHPTVKPISLMRWLCRLVCPSGGVILDPFTGSGTTGCAAVLEGFHFAGVELDPTHTRLAMDRIAHWQSRFSVA